MTVTRLEDTCATRDRASDALTTPLDRSALAPGSSVARGANDPRSTTFAVMGLKVHATLADASNSLTQRLWRGSRHASHNFAVQSRCGGDLVPRACLVKRQRAGIERQPEAPPKLPVPWALAAAIMSAREHVGMRGT